MLMDCSFLAEIQTGSPSLGTSNAHGVEKIYDFRQRTRDISRKWYKIDT